MPSVDDGRVCYIRSTVAAGGKAACLLEWGPVRALLAPPVVLSTARDLLAAAAAAETDVALVRAFRKDVGMDDEMLGFVLSHVRSRRRMAPDGPVLRISAVAGAKTGRPYVHITRGSMKGELTPGEARDMAQHWTEAAVAAQIDVRLRHALKEWDRLNTTEIEQLFTLIQEAGRA